MLVFKREDVRKLCKVRIHTSSAEVSPVILHVAGEHNHPASVDSVEAKVVVSALKKDAVTNSSSKKYLINLEQLSAIRNTSMVL